MQIHYSRGLLAAMAPIKNVLLYMTLLWATSCCLGFRLRGSAAEYYETAEVVMRKHTYISVLYTYDTCMQLHNMHA